MSAVPLTADDAPAREPDADAELARVLQRLADDLARDRADDVRP